MGYYGGEVMAGGNSSRRDASETVELRSGQLTKALRVRKDGIRLGCTFVSKEAVEFIIQAWKNRELYEDR